MKTRMDIAKLLQWAIREELPKGHAVSTDAYGLISSFEKLALGTRIDGGTHDALGFVPGAPHADAVIIGEAVRRLPTGWRLRDHGVTADDLLGDYAALDAGEFAAAAAVPYNLVALVLHNAVMGQEPVWGLGAPQAKQLFSMWRDSFDRLQRAPLVYGTDADGNEFSMRVNRGSAAMRRGMYDLAYAPRSPLAWREPSIAQIAEARAEYTAWHAALDMLARDEPIKTLAAHEVTGPAAPARPWRADRGNGETGPRVFESAACADVRRALPLAPKRPAALPPLKSDIETKMRARRPRAAAQGLR